MQRGMERVGQGSGFAMWLRELDRLLRGDATRPAALRRGTIEVPIDGLAMMILLLGLLYGLCMGCYALFQPVSGAAPPGARLLQVLATTGKVPLLFMLTLVVTFPSLYVFNALVGSRLSVLSVLRLIVAAVAVIVAILASLGPIVAFFSVSTTSYPFMLLLNVAVFTISGALGLRFLLLTLHRLSLAQDEPAPPRQLAAASVELAEVPAPLPQPGALDRGDNRALGRDVVAVFYIWVVVFGLVGAQMSWILRPFLGAPGRPFELLRGRESNFFEGLCHLIGRL